MSNSCDELASAMLSIEEKKEEKERLLSSIYDAKQEISELKSDYEEYQADGQYDEMEDILHQICELESELNEDKEALNNLIGDTGNFYY